MVPAAMVAVGTLSSTQPDALTVTQSFCERNTCKRSSAEVPKGQLRRSRRWPTEAQLEAREGDIYLTRRLRMMRRMTCYRSVLVLVVEWCWLMYPDNLFLVFPRLHHAKFVGKAQPFVGSSPTRLELLQGNQATRIANRSLMQDRIVTNSLSGFIRAHWMRFGLHRASICRIAPCACAYAKSTVPGGIAFGRTTTAAVSNADAKFGLGLNRP